MIEKSKSAPSVREKLLMKIRASEDEIKRLRDAIEALDLKDTSCRTCECYAGNYDFVVLGCWPHCSSKRYLAGFRTDESKRAGDTCEHHSHHPNYYNKEET